MGLGPGLAELLPAAMAPRTTCSSRWCSPGGSSRLFPPLGDRLQRAVSRMLYGQLRLPYVAIMEDAGPRADRPRRACTGLEPDGNRLALRGSSTVGAANCCQTVLGMDDDSMKEVHHGANP